MIHSPRGIYKWSITIWCIKISPNRYSILFFPGCMLFWLSSFYFLQFPPVLLLFVQQNRNSSSWYEILGKRKIRKNISFNISFLMNLYRVYFVFTHTGLFPFMRLSNRYILGFWKNIVSTSHVHKRKMEKSPLLAFN